MWTLTLLRSFPHAAEEEDYGQDDEENDDTDHDTCDRSITQTTAA